MNTARHYTLDAAPGHPPVYTSLALLFADDLRCGFGAAPHPPRIEPTPGGATAGFPALRDRSATPSGERHLVMNAIEMKLTGIERQRHAILPTPVHELPALSSRSDGRVFCKRDDLTGFGFGGNKPGSWTF